MSVWTPTVLFHVNGSVDAKFHAFCLQQGFLQARGVASEFVAGAFAFGIDDTLPRESFGTLVKGPAYCTCRKTPFEPSRYLAVVHDPPSGDAAYDRVDFGEGICLFRFAHEWNNIPIAPWRVVHFTYPTRGRCVQ